MNKKVKKMLNQAFCEIARLDADINELKQNPIFKLESYVGIGEVKTVELKENGIELNKWYKSINNSKFLVFLTQYEGINFCKGYGFNGHGDWDFYDGEKSFGITDCVLATEEEVKEALTKEAKRRGFVKGAKFIGLCGAESYSKKPIKKIGFMKPEKLRITDNCYGLFSGDSYLYRKGEWAKVIQESEEKEIDWSIQGQIVEESDTGLIVMTTGSSHGTYFSGVILEADLDWKKGKISYCWGKQHFKISNKTIKLE